MQWTSRALSDARFSALSFRLQALVIAAFASGSVTAGLLHLARLALVYTARHVHGCWRPASEVSGR